IRVPLVTGVQTCALPILLHAALFFGVLSGVTTLGAFVPGAIRARVWVGLPLGLALISLVAWNATILSRERDVELGLALGAFLVRSEEHTSELQSRVDIVCRLLLEKKK